MRDIRTSWNKNQRMNVKEKYIYHKYPKQKARF